MAAQTILIINKEEVLLLAPLAEFLSKHADHVHTIYHTSFFPPQTDKLDYVKSVLKITDKAYWLRYFVRFFRNKVFGSFLFPASWRRKYNLRYLVNDYRIPFINVFDVNDEAFIRKIKAQRISTALSFTYQLYQSEIINIPGFKIYNFHPGLLPNNKGRWPIFWAIVKGDEHGITCHEINEKIDAGEIILQKNLGRLSGMTIEDVMDIVIKELPMMISTALKKILTDDIQAIISDQPDFYGDAPDTENIKIYWNKVK